MFSIKSIIHRYPEPGHSFLPCDRCFGHIEKVRRKVETVFLPEEYEKLVSETNTKYNVIHVDQSIIFNFTVYLTTLCKKIVTNKEKEKFTIIMLNIIKMKDCIVEHLGTLLLENITIWKKMVKYFI